MSASRTDSCRGELVTPEAFASHGLSRKGAKKTVLARAPKPAREARALLDPKARGAFICFRCLGKGLHRQPIEVVVEQPIPAGKVRVSVNAHQFVIVPVNIGYSLRLFC